MRSIHTDEAGLALSSVMMVIFVVSILVGVISYVTISAVIGGRESSGKAISGPLADAASSKLRAALQNGLMSAVDNYSLTANELKSVTAGSPVYDHAVPSQAAHVPKKFRSMPAGSPRLTVQEQGLADGANGYWQVLRVIPPEPGVDRDVVIWIRTLRGEGTAAGDKYTFALRFRDTPFSSFQLISDDSITLEAGASINGSIHANGNTASVSTPVVRASGPVSCSGSPRVSTARGSIQGVGAPCTLRADSGRSIDLARSDEMASIVEGLCRPSTCIGTAGTESSWDVTVQSASVSWVCTSGPCSNGSIGVPSAWESNKPGTTLLFRGSIQVQGVTNGRLTLWAWDTNTNNPAPSVVAGNLGTTASNTAALGLVTRGDLYIAASDTGECDVTDIRAALASGHGSITLPDYLTQAGTFGSPCPSITITGSITGRQSPILSWSSAGGTVGWAQRNYLYDTRLRATPPPMFPQASGWKVSTSRNLPERCLTVLPNAQARQC